MLFVLRRQPLLLSGGCRIVVAELDVVVAMTARDDLEDALFHRGNELSGDRAASHGVDEFEAGASRQWLHAQHHFTELPGAAGLLLVAIMPLGPSADRFPISDLRWPRHNLELV